jgi:hypothetical protein
MDELLTEANELLAIFAASQRTVKSVNDSMRNEPIGVSAPCHAAWAFNPFTIVLSLHLHDSLSDGDIAVRVVDAQRYGVLARGEGLGFDFEFFRLRVHDTID